MRHQRSAGLLLIGVSVGLLACTGNAETQDASEVMEVADLTMDECWLRDISQEDARAHEQRDQEGGSPHEVGHRLQPRIHGAPPV